MDYGLGMIFSGLLWSLAIMTKTVVLYLPLMLSWFYRKNLKIMIAWLYVVYLFPLLWCAHNKQTIGRFVFTTQSETQLRDYLAVGVASIDQPVKLGESWFDSDKEALESLAYNPVGCIKYFVNGTIKLFGLTEFESILELFGLDRSKIPINQTGRISGAGTHQTLQRWPRLWLPFVIFTGGLCVFYLWFLFGCGS